MTSMTAFIKSHPVLTYFALTFAISWGGVLLVIGGPSGIPATAEQLKLLLPLVVLALTAGPSVASLLLTGLIDGRAGLRELRSRLLRWRVGTRWYAVALLTTPVLAAATLFALALASPAFLPGIFVSPNRAALLLGGVAAGLVGGLFEEPGWTGFAVPRLRLSYGSLTTGLIVGLMWGGWHFIVALWGSGTTSGAFSLLLFLPQLIFYIAVLPAYRVLMVWVYDRTESLLVAMIMHASLTGSILFIFMPLALSEVSLLTWYLALAAALWAVVAAVALANGRKGARNPQRDITNTL